MSERQSTKVCGDCWQDLRPDQYEPNTYNMGECDRCGDQGFVHRVSKQEVEQNPR